MTSTQPTPPEAASTAPLIAWNRCVGTLSDAERSLDVVCDVTVSRDGAVGLRFEDLPVSASTFDFYGTWLNSRGPTVPHYRLALEAENGDRLSTEDAILTGGGTNSTPERSVIHLSGEALALSVAHRPTVDWETAGTTRLATYHLVGLRGLHVHTEDTDAGRVHLVGAGDVQDHGELAGELAVESNADATDDAAWLDATDDRVRGILLMVSLGAGRFVPWSIREFAVGGIRRSLEFRGRRRTGRPFDPLFHRLNLGPALRLGTHHYSRELGERTGLDIAVEWYVMDHSYSEARYLATMTALEHLVTKHETTLGVVLSKTAFRRARESMEAVLEASDTVDKIVGALLTPETDVATARTAAVEALAQLRPKLGNLNRLSLFDSVVRLLDLYRVAHGDIVPDVRRLIRVRNDIAHRGLHASGDACEPLHLTLAALRELLRRLFLGILGYQGPYESHYPEHQTRHFPPIVQATAPPAAAAQGEDPAAPA